MDAVSHYEIIERFRQASLIEVRLETGKRNQIRIQARLRGHTLVGERRYVYGPDELRPIQFERQALHAYRLAFEHPLTGENIRLEAPVPGPRRSGHPAAPVGLKESSGAGSFVRLVAYSTHGYSNL